MDFAKLYSEAGIVSKIQTPMVGTTVARFQYQAPDSRACYVDLSSDNWGTWSRTVDSGAGIARTLTITGLTAATTYQSRILCYFEQQNDGVLYTEWTADQITRGTFTTLAAGSRPVTLSGLRGSAASLRFTLTLIGGGTPVSNTCAADSCSVTAPTGIYTLLIEYLNGSGGVLRSQNEIAISVP